VTVQAGNGHVIETRGYFGLAHFSPGGYKFLLLLPDAQKAQVPIGSILLVDEETFEKLRPSDV